MAGKLGRRPRVQVSYSSDEEESSSLEQETWTLDNQDEHEGTTSRTGCLQQIPRPFWLTFA